MSTTTVEPEKLGTPTFITTDIKLQPIFTDRLAKLAGTDAKHDFGLAYALLDKIQVGLPDSGWPTVDEKKHPFFDESSSLTSVIRAQTQTASSLQVLIPGNEAVDFDIEYGRASEQSIHKYTGIKRFIKNENGFNKGSIFVTECKLQDSVLVVDFNQNGFLEMLTTGTVGTDVVNYVMIPELLNDPAGKTPLDDNIFNKHKPKQGVGTGIELRPWLETTNKTIVYNSYDPQIEAFSNNFFSKYNFQLSPIIATKQISGKSTTMHVTLNILDPASSNQAEVKNCKKENSIKSLLKFLTSLLKNTTKSSPFNYSAKLQQKRSGDWLQALACLDIYNRKFKQFNANNADESFTKTNKVYFVTHDQIACAYALTMGVNAIFINNKNAYVLTNVKNDTSTTPTQRLLSNYQKVLWDIAPNKNYVINTDFRKLKGTFLPGYDLLRTTLINTYDTNITNKLTELETVMNTNSNNCISTSDAEQYSKCIQNIFKECVMYCHVMISLPDPTQIIGIFGAEENENEFKKSADDPSLNSGLIETFVHAYNLAINIKNQHNNLVETSSKWLTALQKSDAYRSASSWQWDYKKSGRIRSFITSIVGGTTDTKNDMYLFLSFIGSINTTIANKITTTFNKYETVVTKTQSGKWDGRVLFTSNNIELIKQIGIFLTRTDADFQKEKNYFAFSPYLSETASAKFYIVDNVITSEKPSNVAEPNYWPGPLCTESVVVPETTQSIKNDNNNPTIGSPQDTVVDITSAYSEPSCDNDGVPIITAESSVGTIENTEMQMVGGFDKSKSVQIVTDISIQQTSVPILTAFLIYGYMTDDSKQLLVDLMEDVNIPASINDTLTAKGQLLELNQIKEDDTYELMGGGFDINDVKISDTSIAYHPLLPIYMIACGYNYNVTPNLEGSLDYDVYIKYLGFLEKMTSVLTGYNYLSNVGQNKSKNIAKSYIIGLALRELLFTLNRDEDGIKILCENGANSALNATRDEYQSFSLMSSMLSDYISGKILEDATEKAFGIQLLQSSVFKNFINVEVDIKSLLNKTLTQQEESISISALNQRSLDLIKKLSDRIVKDRSPGSGNASQGISSSQLSTISMNTGRTSTPDTLSSLTPSSTPIAVGTGGFLKTKKQKRKRNLKTKRRKNKRSNKTTKKRRQRKQSKKTRKH